MDTSVNTIIEGVGGIEAVFQVNRVNLHAVIESSAEKFKGDRKAVKGLHISMDKYPNVNGQTVWILSIVPDPIAEFILNKQKPVCEKYVLGGISRFAVYFNFSSKHFLFNERERGSFFVDWNTAFKKFESQQSTDFRQIIRECLVSEFICIKDTSGIVHIAMEFRLDKRPMTNIGIGNLKI